MSKYLREAHLAIDKIIAAFTEEIGTAQLDVSDVYGDDTLDDVFVRENPPMTPSGSHTTLPVTRRFARMLVERLLHHEGVVLGWDRADEDRESDEPGVGT